MRNLLLTFVVCLVAGLVYAGADGIPLVIEVSETTTNTTFTTEPIDGYIVGLTFSADEAVVTGNVSLVCLTNVNCDTEQTIYSNGAFVSSAPIYPRVPVHNTSGVQLGSATNGFEPMLLVRTRVELRGHSATDSNKTVKAFLQLWDD